MVIEGGTFAGLSSALAAAQQGLKVVLVESRTYLGWEMTACLRPWMHKEEIESRPILPAVIRAILTPHCSKPYGDEVIFALDQVKIALEDLLLQAGVEILYATRVIGTLNEQGRVTGVVIGNKSGRQVIHCRECQRFIPPLRSLNTEGNNARRTKSDQDFLWCTLEFTGLDLSSKKTIPAPDFLRVENEVMYLHRGIFSDYHWYVEFPFSARLIVDAQSKSEGDYTLQMLAAQTAKYLLDHENSFQGACWAGSSEEAWFNPKSLLDSISQAIPSSVRNLAEESEVSTDVPLKIYEENSFDRSAFVFDEVKAFSIPLVRKADILVVGGGTSGVAAAVMAAEAGMKTLVVEMNHRVGGTGTIGGVQSYWFGRDAGFSARRMRDIEVAHSEFHQPVPNGGIPRWNIEVKTWVLCKSLNDRHVDVLYDSLVIATVLSGKTLRGVIVASPEGVECIEASMVIDATGDGDVAVFSGAPFGFGSNRNRSTMWYSIAQYTEQGQTCNNFTSMVEVGNVEDYTRAILSGRRRGQDTIDHGTYLAMRESRHITGEVTLTLTDFLRQRKYADTVLVAFSNYDVKGHTDSDWLRAGLIPPNLEVEIPIRALLPKGLEHLIVIGKAISAAHDAIPIIRMQRDMENLGAVAGLMAAMAVQMRSDLRDLPISDLQRKLVAEGLLTADIPDREILNQPVDVCRQLEQLDGGRPLYAYSDMEMYEIARETLPFVEICCAGTGAIPEIRKEFQSSHGSRRLILAQALAMMGDPSGMEDLVQAVERQLDGVNLPERVSAIRNTQLPPDQGAMPDVVYWLYSLGMLRDERCLPVFEQVVRLLHYSSVDDFYSHSKGIFYYVDAICYASERLGSLSCEKMLLDLQHVPFMNGNVCIESYQADYVKERIAFLELSMGRAMLCCGMPEGLHVVIDYLEDTRATLREHAYSLLLKFTGEKIRMDGPTWRDWYQQEDWILSPCPDDSLTDAQKAWQNES